MSLHDRTGLVVAMHAAAKPTEQNAPVDRLLVVSWLGGCGDHLIEMTFTAEANGYVIAKRDLSRNGCALLYGRSRTIALQLRQPVDAATVRFDAIEESVL